MVELSTYGGWAGVLVVAGGYWYLTKDRRGGRAAARAADPRKSVKSKREKEIGLSSGDGGLQSNEDAPKKAKKAAKNKPAPEKQTSQVAPPTATVTRSDERKKIEVTDDNELDNREFARQLQAAKSGTAVSSQPKTAAPRQKSVKQSKAAEKQVVSPPSSTTGDADDDYSAADSPELSATRGGAVNGDVSDMLEAPSGGPSVLRITQSSDNLPKRESKAPKVQESAETKKQRQRRKKNEERKATAEEDEAERRVLLEKQRRTAREAEGRAAKDGSAFMASKAPTSSAWTAQAPTINGEPSKPAGHVELLDTYDPIAASNASIDNIKAKNDWQSGLPSEDEQMRILSQDAEWATVSKKKTKKASGKPNSESEHEDTNKVATKPTTTEKAGTAQKENANPARRERHSNPMRPAGKFGGLEVQHTATTNGGVETQLEEDEWEVA